MQHSPMQHSPMEHSPVMKIIGMVTWVITALVSINMLTGLYGYDFFTWAVDKAPRIVVPTVWIVGISGVISLAMLAKVMFMCCPGCGACPCVCNKHM